MASALTDVSGSAVCVCVCVRSQEALQHPCILATLSERWLVLGAQLLIEKMYYGMVTQQPAAVTESRPSHPPVCRCCPVVGLGHRSRSFSVGRGGGGEWKWGGGGVNMFVKNCARIRGKLSGNWRHLQNKREEVLLWG